MSPKGSVVARQVWKRFRSDRGRWLLRDQLPRLGALVRRRERSRWRWALRGVDLVAEPGEAVGLVGVNGSGKSTLLKILSGVMYPYAGTVEVSGRIGAMIELRAGLHPDLTGRENVFFYGSMLGLRRREVARRFDEIVAFAELEDAIDRQVKFYSTGMQLRLGFAVAACLEPAVLLVDEVLAVGDAGFQQKCLDRMRALLAQGTTLIFVSHDLPAVEATCGRLVWLSDGIVAAEGSTRDVLRSYRAWIEAAAEALVAEGHLVRVVRANLDGSPDGVSTHEPLTIQLSLESWAEISGSLCIGVSEGSAAPIFLLRRDVQLRPGVTEAICRIRDLPVPRGTFYVWAGLIGPDDRDLLPWQPVGSFEVDGPDLDPSPRGVVRLAPIHIASEWAVSAGRPGAEP